MDLHVNVMAAIYGEVLQFEHKTNFWLTGQFNCCINVHLCSFFLYKHFVHIHFLFGRRYVLPVSHFIIGNL